MNYKEFYSKKSNHLTLDEALTIHYQLNPKFTPWHQYPDEFSQKMMKSHDICHIVFGCDTTLVGEVAVEIWTLFGNDLTAAKYRELATNPDTLKEPLEIAKNVGYFKVFMVMLTNCWRLPYTWYSSRKMKKKWSILDFDIYLDKKLGSIRDEFGIKCLD